MYDASVVLTVDRAQNPTVPVNSQTDL